MTARRTAYIILAVFLSIQAAFYVEVGRQTADAWGLVFMAVGALALILAIAAMVSFMHEAAAPRAPSSGPTIAYRAWIGAVALLILLRFAMAVAGLFPGAGVSVTVSAVWAVLSLGCGWMLMLVRRRPA
jgi:hypothetical protein